MRLFSLNSALIFSLCVYTQFAIGFECPFHFKKIKLARQKYKGSVILSKIDGINFNPPFKVHGEIEELEIEPGFKILKLTEKNGLTHWIDPDYAEIKTESLPTDLPKTIPKGEFNPSLPLHLFNKKKSIDFVCKHFKVLQSDAKGRNLLGAVRKAYTSNPKLLRDLLLNTLTRCGLGGIALFQSFNIYDKVETKNFWIATDHESNFLLGIGGMAAMHQCLTGLSPVNQKLFLKAALGTNIAGNIYFELNLPGDWQYDPDNGKPVQTDIPDLVSGGLATATYYAFAALVENALPVGVLLSMCR